MRRCSGLGSVALALALCGAGGCSRSVDAPAPLSPLDSTALAAQVELAEQDSFYLILELGPKRLSLRYHGAVVRDYPVEAISLGRPRALVRAVEVDGAWRGRVWREATLDPPLEVSRTVIEPPASADTEVETPPVIPPTPEERFPAPDRFRVRFAGGLALEITSREAGRRAGLGEAFGNAWNAGQDGLRIRLQLPAADVGALYRSLPAGISLIVVDRAAPV